MIEIGSAIVGLSGAFVAIYMLRTNKKGAEATTGKISAETSMIKAETQFVGSGYIKDLSEASVALSAPFREEIAALRARVSEFELTIYKLRDEKAALYLENLSLRTDLNSERTEREEIKEIFEARINALQFGGDNGDDEEAPGVGQPDEV